MFRIRVARTLSAPWLTASALRVRAGLRRVQLTALTYHRVVERKVFEAEGDDLIDATTEAFDAQVGALGRLGTFVTATDVARWVDGAAIPRAPVMLTFDDGYLECLKDVLPVLKRRRARATFFVSPGYLDERRLFWWERIRRAVRRTCVPWLELGYPRPTRIRVDIDRAVAIRAAEAVVKETPHLDIERYLADIESAAGVPLSRTEELQAVARTMMDWDHVGRLVDAGMDVQSHTLTHRVLQTLSPSELVDEFVGSREALERRTRRPVVAVAYPVGYSVAHLDHVRAALRLSGYRLGFSNHTGTSTVSARFDPFDVRRIAMDVSYGADVAAAFAAVPALAPTRRARPSARSRSRGLP